MLDAVARCKFARGVMIENMHLNNAFDTGTTQAD